MQELQEPQELQRTPEMPAARDLMGGAGWPSLQDDGHTCGPLCEQELDIAQVHWTELRFAAGLGEA
ncbi:hypothetical protein [Streptacidiphilus sp. BW17]|uniref:hypothetical protein n=2 Tax=Streptacidiphilus TaxID=228398 RepID=UPI003518D3CE